MYYENNYFLAVGHVRNSSNYIIIYRRDTYESYLGLSLINSEKNEWSYCVKHIISRLAKPIDWKRPHRYCLARYYRHQLEQDTFLKALSSNQLAVREIFSYITISQLKETVLIKKLNHLTFEEKNNYLSSKIGKKTFSVLTISIICFRVESICIRGYMIKKGSIIIIWNFVNHLKIYYIRIILRITKVKFIYFLC